MAYTSLPYGTFVSGTTISASEVNANGAAIINGLSDGTKDIGVLAATFTGGVDANSTLQVAGATTLSSTVQVTGAATLSSTIRVAGGATFSGAVAAASTLGVTGALTASSTASFGGAVYTESTLRASGGATFSGAVAMSSTLKCTGIATFSSSLYANNTLLVACGGGDTGNSSSIAGTVTLVIDGTTYNLLRSGAL